MAQVTISITRSDVYAIAEGISVTISRHNGGTPTFEQLWASSSEAPKLDIYYREAVGDLERRLMDWAAATSSQFNLTEDADDYELTLDMSPYWPSRLEGLLDNKIQDYLVHAVTAGWLNDFDGLTVKQDYQAMSAQDLLDILAIIYQREFNFDTSARGSDSATKDEPDAVTAEARGSDSATKDEPDAVTAEARGSDSATKDEPDAVTAEARGSDSATKDEPDAVTAEARGSDSATKDEPDAVTAEARGTDSDNKDRSTIPTHALARKKDDTIKRDNDRRPRLCIQQNLRHRDNAVVDTRADWTDWGGTGMPYRECMPPSPHPQRITRPMTGTGFTPSSVPPPPLPDNHNPYGGMSYGPVPPVPHDPRIPDDPTHPNYPDFYPNGKGWSDEPLYDAEGSERFIQRHDCGHHDCNMAGDKPLDWDLND